MYMCSAYIHTLGASLVPQTVKNVNVKVAQPCRLFATPWTIQSMEFSRPEYWNE